LRTTVDIDTGFETGEFAGPVRERAQAEESLSIECATADRPVAKASHIVEDDVTVQARRSTSRLTIVDP